MPDTPRGSAAAGTPCSLHGQPVYHTTPGNCAGFAGQPYDQQPRTPGTAATVAPVTSFTEPWPTYTPDVLRSAATRLEQRPWLKPAEALRLWADALEMESRNAV